MEYFNVVQMRWVFLMLSGGLALTLVILLGFLGRSARAPRGGEGAAEHEGYSAPRAIPWFLIVIWVSAGLFIIGYVLWAAYGRPNF